MKTITKKLFIATFSLILLSGLSSCNAIKNANNKQKGAVIGATSGAILGAIIGNNAGKGGNGKLGAVIGGVVGGAAGVIIGHDMDKQAQKIEKEVPGAKVERVDDGIVVTFDDNGGGVYFATNKYNINTDSRTTLNKLAGVLYEFPDTRILVVGHTDSVGSESYNMRLSKRRAKSVSGYLTREKGLSSSRFTTRWFGETKPTHDNSTAAGRAKNRRVNIVILPSQKMIEKAKKESIKD